MEEKPQRLAAAYGRAKPPYCKGSVSSRAAQICGAAVHDPSSHLWLRPKDGLGRQLE